MNFLKEIRIGKRVAKYIFGKKKIFASIIYNFTALFKGLGDL